MDNNVFECQIFQAIKDIQKQYKRPNINAIFKNITRANATNITVEDVKQQVNLLIVSTKLKKHANLARIKFILYCRKLHHITSRFDLRMSTRSQYR